MLAFGFTDRSSLGLQVKSLYTRWVIYGLVLSFLPGVDFWAHMGGIAGGFVAGLAGQHASRAADVEGAIAEGFGGRMYRGDCGCVRDDVYGDH